jgi:hypothetical protein
MQYDFDMYEGDKRQGQVVVHRATSREDAEQRARAAFPEKMNLVLVLRNTEDDL